MLNKIINSIYAGLDTVSRYHSGPFLAILAVVVLIVLIYAASK